MSYLKISSLTKIFPGGTKALDEFNLEIGKGEFIAIVGPSGCGKSTLLRILAGLEPETSGSIILDDKEITGVTPKLRDMAFMFQNYALFPHLTLAENMGFGLKLRKTPKVEMEKKISEVAQTLGIAELLNRYPSETSGGQRQRAALGRAILRSPKVFLFDEPLSNLDAKMRAQMRVEISKLHRTLGTTMILVTHDQIEAMTMGDRVVVLKDGVIQQVADPDTLYQSPANAFVASFIGSPGMNLFTGQLEKKNEQLWFNNSVLEFSLTKFLTAEKLKTLANFSNKEIMIGIRPEDIGSNKAHALDSAPTLMGMLGVEEKLGDQLCLYFEAKKNRDEKPVDWAAKIIKSDAEKKWQRGQEISLPMDVFKMNFFDAISGKNLFLNQ